MGRPKGSWTGPSNPNWKGGIRRAQGYVFLQRPDHPKAGKNGYVREHVLIMSDHIGRPIATNEIVHHRDGVRDHNWIENLELMTRSAHHSLHHKGVRKENSIKALRGRTSEEWKHIWNTTLLHKRMKPHTCAGCGIDFYRKGTRPKYCTHSCYARSRIKTSHP